MKYINVQYKLELIWKFFYVMFNIITLINVLKFVFFCDANNVPNKIYQPYKKYYTYYAIGVSKW